jgi:sec-independent protein translocase protein TatA
VFSGLLQPTHLIILLGVALLFLGPRRLPEAGRALGQGLREFRTSIAASHDDDHQIPANTSAPPVNPAPVTSPPQRSNSAE